MSKTVVSKAAEDIIVIEQYCQEEALVHTVIITQEDLFDLCSLMWPKEQARWIEICAAEGKPWPPIPQIEKNPQGAPEGPEGVALVSTAAQAAGAYPADRPEG